MALLELRNITKQFGGLQALTDVSFSLQQGTILGLIGPNGAGKTTAFNIIAGAYRSTSGVVLYGGTDITRKHAHEIARLGVCRTYQNIRLFKNLTVEDNVFIGGIHTFRTGAYAGILGLRSASRETQELRTKVADTLEFFGIQDLAAVKVANLPYGSQRLVEIARATIGEPSLILLDEPTAGMNPQETRNVMGIISSLKSSATSVLVIEHDMNVVMGICETIVVLNYGRKIAEGSPKEIQADPKVIEAYLGSSRRYA